MESERGRPLSHHEECLLAWARIHQEPDSGVGWRAVLRSWVEMLDRGSAPSQDHAAARLRTTKELVMQGFELITAVTYAIEDDDAV
jgi:hypothetical protein